MPTTYDCLKEFCNRKDKTPKKGHFWASAIHAIKKGYTTPKNFYEQKEIDGRGIANICQGIAGEDFLARVFKSCGVQCEHDNEASHFKIKLSGGIYVSGRADFLFRDKVFECKAPVREFEEIPDHYKDQLEAQWQAFHLPVYLCEIRFNPFRTQLWPYDPSDERWEDTKTTLIEFNKKL